MILVTGASGFVGRRLLAELARRGVPVIGAVRRSPANPLEGAAYVTGTDLSPQSSWATALDGVETVIHAAARVHVMNDTASDPLAEFRRINVAGSANLAMQADAAGVRRFVFISSIKVNGERNVEGQPFRTTDNPAPADPYGISKWEAELELQRIAKATGLEVVIIRPVLVYGPGVKANVETMMRWLQRGVPLPFGAIDNKRSLVALRNLVDLIITCVEHPRAPGETFLVSDGEDLSTTALLKRMASALGVSPRLIPVPASMLRVATRLLGREDLGRRLFESLQVDIAHTRERLDWTPPIGVNDALRETAADFLERSRE
jgi:Nucleoside-diphosphate-sugar epimerases